MYPLLRSGSTSLPDVKPKDRIMFRYCRMMCLRNSWMKARKGVDYAAFLLANTAIVNYRGFQAGDLVAFNSLGEIIEIINDGGMTIDVILFGGEPYSEGIVAEGSFVMNTPHEITQAYN